MDVGEVSMLLVLVRNSQVRAGVLSLETRTFVLRPRWPFVGACLETFRFYGSDPALPPVMAFCNENGLLKFLLGLLLVLP